MNVDVDSNYGDSDVEEKEDNTLTHVILPRVLPHKSSDDLHTTELNLMDQMANTVRDLDEWIPPTTVTMFQNLQNMCANSIPQFVSNAINQLGPGDTFAMFVQFQRCAVMIHVPPDETVNNIQNVIVATFPGSLDSSEIYGRDSDIEFNYPERAISVKFSQMMRSREFANELCVLNEALPVGYTRLDCVTKWLPTLLMDKESKAATVEEFPVITKKIRDEAWGNGEMDCFRRSSLYMCIKAMLEHNLIMQLGADAGKILYKIVMLQFLVNTCDPYKNGESFHLDLMSQMIAKMARRIEKLADSMDIIGNEERSPILIEGNDIMALYDQVIGAAKKTINIIRRIINARVKTKRSEIEKLAKLPQLSGLDFKSDISHKIPKLQEYLKGRQQNVDVIVDGGIKMEWESDGQNDDSKRPNYVTYERHFKNVQLPKIQCTNEPISELDSRILWMDFERKVLYEMEIEEHFKPNKLRTWAIAYAKYAEEHYKDNQLFISRMLLVRLKLIAMLDNRATKKFPLLLKHRSGVNLNVFDCLLLPQHADMCIAFQLEEYFCQRNRATNASLIEKKAINRTSFSVKFGKTNEKMIKTRDDILALDEEEVEKTKKKWEALVKKANDLRIRANGMKCVPHTKRYGHERNCERCQLKKMADSMGMKPYQHLLPENELEQIAIAFELNIPRTIGSLRDILYDFGVFCSGDPQKVRIKYDWNEMLQAFDRSNSYSIQLGSTISQKLEKIRVSNAFSKFVVENTSDCVLHFEKRPMIFSTKIEQIKSTCTFKVQGEYDCLQWTLVNNNKVTHTENQVLSSQSKCPTCLPLPEYRNFGSLRADGHRLQIRKLYAMIETEGLSFEKESVLALVMQTLWECGPSGGESIREAHKDLGNVAFCDAMIDLINKFIDEQQKNWMNPIKLLTATLIAVRAFEINDSHVLADKIVTLLSHIRSIALDWMQSIEKTIREKTNEESTERNLRMKLIYVAIIGGLTFFVNPNHKYYEKIFRISRDDNESTTWLRFIISLTNNVRMYINDEQQLPSNLRMFLRLIESVGVSMEEKVRELSMQVPNKIRELIRVQWPRAEYAHIKDINYDQEYPHILVVVVRVDITDQIVTIDIINGSFLVDGLPLSHLPSEISSSKLYKWFFGNVVLEVQPDGPGSFSTVQRYNDCTYEFRMANATDVIITEKKGNEFEKELIDQSVFDIEFPNSLVNEYSHWWNKQGKCIEFRQRTTNGPRHFSKETAVEYRLDLATRHLICLQTQCLMLDIKSKSYEKIAKQLQRLEDPRYIHVVCTADARDAKVELFRMNLNFTAKAIGKTKKFNLISNEFNEMRVSRSQSIGTLYGMNHGLFLESTVDGRQILLIPNGNDIIRKKGMFASVKIDTQSELQNPPFYRYQVDPMQLKSSSGSHTSWFYLAYLHAITSHGEVEPFTGMTGTERALQILQSAFAWSSAPYEPGAFKILEKIAHLTPIRKLEDGIQHVSWPKGIPASAAQDCFVFIAKKLLADSERLRSLHGESSDKRIDIHKELALNKRDHRRCQPLNPNLCVSEAFIERKVLTTSSPHRKADELCDDTRTLCILYHAKQFRVPSEEGMLHNFLIGKSDKSLSGFGDDESFQTMLQDLISHSIQDSFRDVWISLYLAAIWRKLNAEQFALILSFYAHREEEFRPILALQTIATNRSQFKDYIPPTYDSYTLSAGTYINADGTTKSEEIRNLIMQFYHQPAEYESADWRNSGRKQHHDITRNAIIFNITAAIERNWPCNSVEFINECQFEYIDFVGVSDAINRKIGIWYANYELEVFLQEVESLLGSLTPPNFSIGKLLPCPAPVSTPKNWVRTSIDFEAKICKNTGSFENKIAEARNVWEMKTKESRYTSKYWWKVYKDICDYNETHHLIQAGIFPRMVPSLLLPRLMDPQFDNGLKCVIGAYAVEFSREQRQARIWAYHKRSQLQADAEREEEENIFENWIPSDYPERVLFQIEQNLTIRRIQTEVANRMIDPPETDTKHSVMQLNMGEGKTAVIVPILAVKLSDGTQVCQIIVLKSLLQTNLKSFRQYLGGLLNRRIYLFPCRRDMPIERYAHEILNIYEECKREKGVILALPEHRLSFNLKIYELISLQLKKDAGRNFNSANTLLDTLKWTNANVRTILDESDAILQAKYQLIYAVGKQMPPHGESLRWLVPQAVLKRVMIHMLKFRSDKVEFGHSNGVCPGVNNRTDIFTPCRVLDETIFDAVKDALIDDFLEGRLDIDFPVIENTKKQSIADLLKNKTPARKSFKIIEDFPVDKQNILFILSGLLRFEVLKLALTKRWRVNYGVDVKGKRRMAIPFKAKDVAAELTEFGHPDVAVCFTQMSYYYSGLTDAQLYEVFSILENLPEVKSVYAKWIDSIPGVLRSPSIASYNAVNLDDSDQRGQLFPLLRFNVHVIDFWLSNMVYPQELKIFEQKLMCTAWDLCSDQFNHRVTGFSGTNDTKNILPITISQNDLKELESTNANMRQILLDPKNEVYEYSEMSSMSGKEIIEKLVELKIPVLLDSGALMLELNNKEVAVEWLKLMPNCDAAIYFDECDTLQTIDRNQIVTEFDCSVYREDLSKCVVYLDDVHTRGTDLKFPANWKACVTLSGDITRDKTVQSCMRMRKLAATQSILFLASYEADLHLRNLSAGRKVESKHVMQFIEGNSQRFETENMVHWATGALNYAKKLSGHKLYENMDEESDLGMLYLACVDDDFAQLSAMFGEKEDAQLTTIAWEKFNKLASKYKQNKQVRRIIDEIRDNVFDKLELLAPNVKRFTHALDEEQEKELEQEIEEQKQVELPPDAKPAEPKFDERLKELVTDGVGAGKTFKDIKADGTILSIAASLTNTQLAQYCEDNEEAWAGHLFVTKDFKTVVDSRSQAPSDFMRPVCWVACIKNPAGNDILIILSSFECNRLMAAFRKSVNSTLYMYIPRLSNGQCNLLHKNGLKLTAMPETNAIDVDDEVQIGVYAGLMYFASVAEQNAYCAFLGLIPRPWTQQQQTANAEGIIDDNGFVPANKRKTSVTSCVGQCKFKDNPTDLAIELIKAHHRLLPKDSHVASILNRGIKALNADEPMEID